MSGTVETVELRTQRAGVGMQLAALLVLVLVLSSCSIGQRDTVRLGDIGFEGDDDRVRVVFQCADDGFLEILGPAIVGEDSEYWWRRDEAEWNRRSAGTALALFEAQAEAFATCEDRVYVDGDQLVIGGRDD